MATLLDDHLVADAMANLPEWSGDAKRITRTVRCSGAEDLLAQVGEVADALDHHPVVERDGDAVTFVLWTHSQGGVTELDIALASRIDDLVLTCEHMQRSAQGHVHTARPRIEAGGQTTPSRPEESSTGAPYPADQGAAKDPGTFHEPANPRQGAGPVALPDDEPGSIEPMPGNGEAPGMQERQD